MVMSVMCACMLSQLQPTRLLYSWDSPGKNTGVGCHPSSRDLCNPGIQSASSVTPALQTDSLSLSHPGSPVSVMAKTKSGYWCRECWRLGCIGISITSHVKDVRWSMIRGYRNAGKGPRKGNCPDCWLQLRLLLQLL